MRKCRAASNRSAVRVARDAGGPWFQITMQFHCFSLLFGVLNRCLVEGEIVGFTYDFPKPGTKAPTPKETLEVRVGKQACGVSYFKA